MLSTSINHNGLLKIADFCCCCQLSDLLYWWVSSHVYYTLFRFICIHIEWFLFFDLTYLISSTFEYLIWKFISMIKLTKNKQDQSNGDRNPVNKNLFWSSMIFDCSTIDLDGRGQNIACSSHDRNNQLRKSCLFIIRFFFDLFSLLIIWIWRQWTMHFCLLG